MCVMQKPYKEKLPKYRSAYARNEGRKEGRKGGRERKIDVLTSSC